MAITGLYGPAIFVVLLDGEKEIAKRIAGANQEPGTKGKKKLERKKERGKEKREYG